MTMKIGIMQPYFFPYIGYFDLINLCDKWVVFDSVQYIRHGWVNRNRILHPAGGWKYVIVPVQKHSRKTFIHDINICFDFNWQDRILGQIQHYKKSAPYFNEACQIVQSCLTMEEKSISKLNVSILAKICSYIDIQFDYLFFSEMDLQLGEIYEPGDWALQIAEAMNASEYINPSGGIKLFDEEKFKQKKIKLTIRKVPQLRYRCSNYEYVPDLSIIDVLMWNSPETVKQHLDKYR